MAKVKLTVYVAPDIRDLAHKLKEQTGRSISYIVEQAIREWDRREGQQAPTDPPRD